MSTLSVDAITGKSTSTNLTIGSTPVVSSSANSMTIRGEGTAQTSIQQGLCKTWCVWVGDGSAISDSLNVASLTDNTTGDFTIAHANDMASANYHHSGSVIYTAGTSLNATGQVDTQDGTGHRAAATHRVVTRYTSASTNDADFDFGVATLGTFGDLA